MKRKRGIALFLTLMISGVLVMMVTALLFTARGGSVFSHDYHGKKAAYYAAESGLSVLQQRLADNPSYRTSKTESTPFGNGQFTVRFGPGECINNMDGTSPLAGPYGEVPAGSCYVRVTGEALGHREVIECMLGRKDSDFIAAAVVASGKIFLDGNIKVAGRHSNGLMTHTAADIISNYDKATWTGHRPLHYILEAGETASVDGVLRSSSPSSSAISGDLAGVANGAVTNQSPLPMKNIDITTIVNSKSSNSAPPSTSGSLTGTYYNSGNFTVPGDLELADADLYIKGDLTVIGSIKGRGSVYVTGDTVFSGDSMVSSDEDGIALYSKGNVSLTGFNGDAYMTAVTNSAGGDAPAKWTQTKDDFALLADYIGSDDPARFRVYSSDPNAFWGSDIGKLIDFMSNQAYWGTEHPTIGTSAQRNNLIDLGDLVSGQTGSQAQAFMLKKFRALRSGANRGAPGRDVNLTGAIGITYSSTTEIEEQKIHDFVNDDVIGDGLFTKLVWIKTSRLEGSRQYTGVSDAEIEIALRKSANWLQNFEYDKLGSSFFQGAIYTRGAFYADNEVTIVGSVSVVADPDDAPSRSDFVPVSGVRLRPGDLYLGNGTNITFVSDIAPGSDEAEPRVGISYWLR
jgi:hypothetical protein